MKKCKIGFISLGCPKNQVDTEVMLKELMDAGYELTGEDIEADIIIVNTCAFIESAKKESIDNILDVAWLKKNGKLKGIIVCGCMAERYREEILAEMPEVDAVLGVGSLHSIVAAVEAVAKGKKGYTCFDDKDSMPLGGERVVTTAEHTAYLKIAEGCDNRCTYCAIPSIRGKFRSRTIEDIVAEAKTLEEIGVKELVLVAQDTTRYGEDLYGGYKLPELVRAICDATAIPWIRLLYCYPDKITDELIEEFKQNDRLLNYIDIPIQHISAKVLKRMNRHGGAAAVRDAISKLRGVEGMVLRTTAIVGFPGESEEDFTELCEFIKETKFDRFGVFTYSKEEGTPAAEFEDQIDEQVKQDRMDNIMELQLTINEELNEKKVGSVIKVLCEGFDPVSEAYYGRSYADAPDIDGKVYFTGPKGIKEGSFVMVKVTEVLDYDLVGETK